MSTEEKLEGLIVRERAKVEALRPHTPEAHKVCRRAELRLAGHEAKLAELRQQEHLHPIPLVAEPLRLHHAHVETDQRREALVTFDAWTVPTVDEEERKPDRVQLGFSGVMHLAVVEEFHDRHRRRFLGRGYFRRFSFFALRRSLLAPELQACRETPPLTHWVFYLWRMRVEVVASLVQMTPGNARLGNADAD